MELDTRSFVVRGLLTADECDALIAWQDEHAEALVPPHGGGHLRAAPPDRNDLPGMPKLLDALMQANEVAGWQIPMDIVRFGLSSYWAPGDSMGRHIDDEERSLDRSIWSIPHRGVSASVQLSQPSAYTGGELYVRTGEDPERWRVAPRGRGDCTLFGASTEHGVAPVTTGRRYALLGWAYCNHNMRPIE